MERLGVCTVVEAFYNRADAGSFGNLDSEAPTSDLEGITKAKQELKQRIDAIYESADAAVDASNAMRACQKALVMEHLDDTECPDARTAESDKNEEDVAPMPM